MQAAKLYLPWVTAERETAGFGYAMFLPMNTEAMQVRIIPTHDDLDGIMEIGEILVTWYEDAPPNRRADLQKENMKLVDFSRRFFFSQGLFSFILSSAWKHLDAFFQLLTARQ